jgi:hypothetical protein
LELEFYYQNASTADATVDIPIANTITKQQLQLIGSWLDLASVLLYLVIVLFIILYQQHVLEEVSAKTVTVTDYSVQVWDLPKVRIILRLQCYGSYWCHRARPHQRKCHIEAIQQSDSHVHNTNHSCMLALFKASLLVHTEAKPKFRAVSDQYLRTGIIANPMD